jgi:magnesium chelatase subunit D
VLDRGEVALQRDGFAQVRPARFGVVALDEGIDDEALPASLGERLALHVELDAAAAALAAAPVDAIAGVDGDLPDAQALAAARARLPRVEAGPEVLEALAAAAAAFGVGSLRAEVFALRAARAAAALDGRPAVQADDLALAVQLVLIPRATRWPASGDDEAAEPEPDEPPPDPPPEEPPAPPPGETEVEPLAERVIAAALAALPAGMLALLRAGPEAARTASLAQAGRRGEPLVTRSHGRVIGVREGLPRDGARLSVIETLRAAAPWQRLRRTARGRPGGARVNVRAADLRVTRHEQRRSTTTLFLVDASGSAALHRMAEAKGAVELLLADCYARRDRVALVAFRGRGAQLLLPPTRALVRARRSLAALPGGGGTPLASGLDLACAMLTSARREGDTPLVVLLTDGRANVARDGRGGRAQAEADALASAQAFARLGCAALLIDTSPHPGPAARRIAEAMRARYLALPHAAADAVSRAVRAQRG